jgi:hypothetical protein
MAATEEQIRLASDLKDALLEAYDPENWSRIWRATGNSLGN